MILIARLCIFLNDDVIHDNDQLFRYFSPSAVTHSVTTQKYRDLLCMDESQKFIWACLHRDLCASVFLNCAFYPVVGLILNKHAKTQCVATDTHSLIDEHFPLKAWLVLLDGSMHLMLYSPRLNNIELLCFTLTQQRIKMFSFYFVSWMS